MFWSDLVACSLVAEVADALQGAHLAFKNGVCALLQLELLSNLELTPACAGWSVNHDVLCKHR